MNKNLHSTKLQLIIESNPTSLIPKISPPNHIFYLTLLFLPGGKQIPELHKFHCSTVSIQAKENSSFLKKAWSSCQWYLIVKTSIVELIQAELIEHLRAANYNFPIWLPFSHLFKFPCFNSFPDLISETYYLYSLSKFLRKSNSMCYVKIASLTFW